MAEKAAEDETRLDILWRNIYDFYKGIDAQEEFEKRVLVTNGIGHISNVVDNAKTLYQILEKEPTEEVQAAAMCHDLGYLICRFDDPAKYHDVDIGTNHGIYSGQICETYLRGLGWSSSQINKIKRLVIAHNEDPSTLVGEEEKVLYIADKLTRLGKGGLERLCTSRRYDPSNESRAQKVLKEARRIMARTYAELKELGTAKDYIEEKYKEGIQALEEEEQSLNKGKEESNSKKE